MTRRYGEFTVIHAETALDLADEILKENTWHSGRSTVVRGNVGLDSKVVDGNVTAKIFQEVK